jgi:hypothetical protein
MSAFGRKADLARESRYVVFWTHSGHARLSARSPEGPIFVDRRLVRQAR